MNLHVSVYTYVPVCAREGRKQYIQMGIEECTNHSGSQSVSWAEETDRVNHFRGHKLFSEDGKNFFHISQPHSPLHLTSPSAFRDA